MSTNEKGIPQSRTYTENDIASIIRSGAAQPITCQLQIVQDDQHLQHDPHLQKVL